MSDEEISALESARCAEINLGNLGDMYLGLKDSPFFKIVLTQIQECVRKLEENDQEKEKG